MHEIARQVRTSLTLRKDCERFAVCFESCGVILRILSNSAEAIEKCRELLLSALPGHFKFVAFDEQARFTFHLKWNPSRRDTLYLDGRPLARATARTTIFEILGPRIRLLVAGSSKEFVFVHAGVVVFNSKCLVLPGHSMQGKTTMIAELIKRGAIYYSDEYAMIDRYGMIHPFLKTLSVRRSQDRYAQSEVSIGDLGGRSGTQPIKADVVLFTSYKPGAIWAPETLSGAAGIVEMIRNTIPTRDNPAFVLSVLSRVANSATFVETERGDVSESASLVLYLLERGAQLDKEITCAS